MAKHTLRQNRDHQRIRPHGAEEGAEEMKRLIMCEGTNELVHYHVILSSNSSTIRLGSGTPDHAVMLPGL